MGGHFFPKGKGIVKNLLRQPRIFNFLQDLRMKFVHFLF